MEAKPERQKDTPAITNTPKQTRARESIRVMSRATTRESATANRPCQAVTRPAQVAVYPRLVCSHSGISTTEAKKVPYTTHIIAVLAANPRWRKTRRSTIGWSSVSSQLMKARNVSPAKIARARMKGESNQSRSLPLSSMICMAPTQTMRRIRPKKSIGRRSVAVSRLRSMRQAKKAQISAGGTLMKNTHGQPGPSTRTPPSRGPTIGPTTVVMPHRPSAMGWSC